MEEENHTVMDLPGETPRHLDILYLAAAVPIITVDVVEVEEHYLTALPEPEVHTGMQVEMARRKLEEGAREVVVELEVPVAMLQQILLEVMVAAVPRVVHRGQFVLAVRMLAQAEAADAKAVGKLPVLEGMAAAATEEHRRMHHRVHPVMATEEAEAVLMLEVAQMESSSFITNINEILC